MPKREVADIQELKSIEGQEVAVGDWLEITQERIITEYKKIDGLPQPSKITVNRDGKKFLEAEMTEYKQFEKLGDEMFTVP